MSPIILQGSGTSTGRRQHRNGYYEFTGPVVRTLPSPTPPTPDEAFRTRTVS
jgi:hypothetical protein